jgi:hypothetical protein
MMAAPARYLYETADADITLIQTGPAADVALRKK